MTGIEERLKEIVEGVLKEHPELFLVELVVKGTIGSQLIVIHIDGEPSLTIDQCGKVSRQIGSILEELDLMTGKYALEVTSPGLDQPLKNSRQYYKNHGREVKVTLKNGTLISGKLEDSNDDVIVVLDQTTRREINLKEVEKTHVLVSFS